jgi:hypothetical protein
MITLEQIPARWLEILAAVRTKYPGALLGGGCLRDLALGHEAKDLDIFVPCDAEPGYPGLYAAGMGHFAPVLNGYGEGIKDVYEVFNTNVRDFQQPIQLVFLRHPTLSFDDLFARFDFTICQIATDGEKVVWSDAFTEDFAAKRFRVHPNCPQDKLERSRRRLVKFLAKYGPTFEYIDPIDGLPVPVGPALSLEDFGALYPSTQLVGDEIRFNEFRL